MDTYNEVPEEGENECLQCKEICVGQFCSRQCEREYILDMETD